MKSHRQVALAVSVLFVAVSANAQSGGKQVAPPSGAMIQSVKGVDLYRAYCASCHGEDGKGNGPAASAMKISPPDLTRISERNGGQFPEARMTQIIAGDQAITAHGSRAMPVWGPVFHQIENDQDWGHVRLHNLIGYLISLQTKPKNPAPAK